MSVFPLTKSITLANYVRTLRAIGAPVDAGLRRARLPVLFEEIPNTWLPYKQQRMFIADMADREGIPNLGLVALSPDPRQVLVPGFFDPVTNAPTLYQALVRLPSLTNRQTTHLKNWIEMAGDDQVRFCLILPLPLEVPGYASHETRTLRLMEMVVRAYTGPDFMPTRVLLMSRARDLNFDLKSAYGNVPVMTDQPYGAIEFPRALLSTTRTSADVSAAGFSASMSGQVPPATFSKTLEACLEPYLLDDYPNIELAAEIGGCSVRTLQRKLRKEQTTYSEIIDKVRCHAALSKLQNTNITLDELSLKLGYSEQSAFTRAFRRWTGTTPNEYRLGTLKAQPGQTRSNLA